MQVTLAQGHTGSRSATYSAYVRVLTWLFTLTSSIRVLTYLPAIAAIVASGDSSQHSLWTWGAWFASNLTMAIWLWEHNGQRCNRAVAVNLGNAAMCAATVVVVVAYRF
jgi:hypothetical protein